MKLVSIFFKASAGNLRGLPQRYNKRARNAKLVLAFLTASTENLRDLSQRQQTSEVHQDDTLRLPQQTTPPKNNLRKQSKMLLAEMGFL